MSEGNNLFNRAKYSYYSSLSSYDKAKKDVKSKAAGYNMTAFYLHQAIEFYLCD